MVLEIVVVGTDLNGVGRLARLDALCVIFQSVNDEGYLQPVVVNMTDIDEVFQGDQFVADRLDINITTFSGAKIHVQVVRVLIIIDSDPGVCSTTDINDDFDSDPDKGGLLHKTVDNIESCVDGCFITPVGNEEEVIDSDPDDVCNNVSEVGRDKNDARLAINIPPS